MGADAIEGLWRIAGWIGKTHAVQAVKILVTITIELSLGHKNRRISGRVRPVESCRRDVGEVEEGTEQEEKAEKRCSNKVIIMTIHMKRNKKKKKKKEQQIALNTDSSKNSGSEI